jgi:DNA processing protein
LKVENKLRNWLALHRVPGIGPIKFQKCLLKDKALARLPSWVQPDWKAVELDLKWRQQKNCNILTLLDTDYPQILKEIANPPPVLFVQGSVAILQTRQIAIVGSRYPSHTGIEIARNFAKHFVELGFTITSGLALGIDTASHQGALTCGKTIAILGCGLDQIYPAANKKLATEIIDNGGALVSEFPIGIKPKAGNFPSRNRIISGLSLGVLVVEAAASSGALITAEIAAEQGREVFAVPGSIYNMKTKGCHKLIKQGAKLVDSANDVLEELNLLLNRPVINKSCFEDQKTGTILSNVALAPEHIELLSYINSHVTSVDEIVINSKHPVHKVSNILVQLELDGHITAVPGGYVRY